MKPLPATLAEASRATYARRKKRGEVVAPESSWDSVVQDYADLMGWWSFHVRDARRLRAGFLDWFLVRPPRVVFLETKVPGGRLEPEQADLADRLGRCPGVEVLVALLPDDWPKVRDLLAGGAVPGATRQQQEG